MQRACIVLPTYNEAPNVRILLPRIFAQAGQVAAATGGAVPAGELHVLVVDDGSPDGTQEVVRGLMAGEPRLHLVTGRKEGLGVAYLRGFAHALGALKADLVLQMDADLQHPPELLPTFLHLATRGYDVVIGSRFAPGGATPDFPWRRRAMSRVGNALVRGLGGLPALHDCTSGFRCLRAEALRRCDLTGLATRGYAFQTSLLGELMRQGARPIEVPMVFRARLHGDSKLTLRDQLEFLGNLLRVRFRRLLAWARRAAAAVGRALRPAARRPRPAPARATRQPPVAAAPRPAVAEVAG